MIIQSNPISSEKRNTKSTAMKDEKSNSGISHPNRSLMSWAATRTYLAAREKEKRKKTASSVMIRPRAKLAPSVVTMVMSFTESLRPVTVRLTMSYRRPGSFLQIKAAL